MEYTEKELEQKARRLRYLVVKAVGCGKTGHIGGSCSIADVVAVLYFHKMKHDPKNPEWEERDRFILSKGHSALVQYAALAECGYFSMDEINKVKKLGCMLQGHPDMTKIPGVEGNTGSLGQGLSIACGIAAGAKIDGRDYKVYCVVGDGEMAEGQIWEAAMSAAFYKLDNLRVVLDCNRLQATGFIKERFDTGSAAEKWKAFGWKVMEINGHNITEIMNVLDAADQVKGKPVAILANTIKGKGIPFAENVAAFHNSSMTPEQYEQACGLFLQNGGEVR